ncbi:MAG: RHS repeat-associated core domain-containing protein [Planctomycetota bacterium]
MTGGRIEHAADPDPDPEEPDHPVRSLIDGIVWYAGDGTRHVFELDSGGAVTNDARHFVSKTMYGRLAELQNSEGLVTGYRFIDPAGMSYRFDAVGRLTQIADNFGDGVMVMHGGNGQIESVQDLRATGNDQQLSFDWTGGNLTLSDHTGREWFFEVKDPNGLNHDALTRVTARGSNGSGADDLSSTYTYYEDPVRKSLLKDVWQGRKGSDGADTTEAKQTSYEYYANRRAMRVTLPDDRREHFWYRLGLYGTTAENEGSADERAVTFGRDFAGAVTTFVDGSGDIVRYSIADTGEVLRETFFDSTTRQAEWNDRGQQLAITDAYGQTETFDYDDNLHRSTSGVYSASNEISGDSFVSGVLLEQEDREGREMLYHYGGYTNSSLTSRASELIYQPDEGGSYHLMPLVEIRDLGGVDRIVAKFDHEYSSDGGATYLDPAPGNGLFDNANDDGLRFRLINQIDALNHVTEYRYVGASIESLPTEVERPGTGSVGDLAGSQASLTRYLYNAAGQVIAEGLSDPADPAPAIVSLYSYDDAGRLVAQVSPNEVAEITGLTFGAPIVNGQGDPLHPEQTTSFKYDTHGRLVSTRGVDPDKVVPAQDEDLPSPFTKQEYDARGNVTRSHIYDNGGANQATADGALVTETIYDDQDRPVLMTYADGTQQRMTYDGVGRLSTQTDALGRTTRLTYDRRGRLSATVLPDGSIVRQRVDGGGRVVATTDPNGNTTKLHYDVLGRLIKQVDPAPADKPASEDVRSTEWVYDARGNLASIVDARDNRTLFAYDDLDRVTHTVNALGAKQADSDGDGLINNTSQGALDGLDHTVKTKYDARGNVIESTDPNDNTTQSFYDFANRLIETTTSDPDGDLSSGAGALTTKFVYDDNGNLTQVLVEPDGNVAVTVTEYDRLNRAIKVTQPDPDGSGNQASPEVESVFDALGRLIRTIDPNDNPTAYEHDKLGRVIAVIDAGDDNHPDGNRYATFYDAAGQVIATETPLGEISRTEYDRLGRVVRETAPDPDGPGPQGTSTITFVYDDAGNLVSSTDARGNVTSYRYDNRNRLVQTIYPSTDTPPDVIEITGDTYVRGGGFANNTQAAIGHESSNEIFVKNAGDHQPQFDRVGVLRIDVPDSLIDLINSPKGLHRDVDLVLELELVSAANAPAPDNTNATQTEQHIYLLNESLSGDLAAKTWNSLLPGVGDPVVSADHDTLADYGQLLASTTIAVGEHSSGRVSLTLSDGPNRQALIDHIAANGSLSLIIGGPAVGDGVLVKYASSESGNEADQPRLRVQGPLAPTQDLSYDAVGNVISTTDELGRTWLYGYDELNRQVRETAPADHDQPGLFWEVWRDRDWRQHIHSTSTFKGIDLEDPGATGVRSDGQFLTGFSSGRQEYFVYRHTAIFEIESAGEYVFDLSANDGARIYIDDQFLLDITNPYNSAGGWESGGDSIWLDAGEHFLVVDYLQHVDARGISVKYTGPDTSGAQVHLNTEGSFVLPGPTSRQEYDANGNLVKTIDPNGNETLYFYDALNRLVRTVNAEVEGSGQSPDANGVGADNYTVETVYDTRGRVVLTIDELGREYGTMYDNLNRVVASIAPDPATGLAFAGDASASRFAALAGDDSQIVGRVTTYTYDDAGNLLSVVDPLGRASYTQYDQLHRPIATVNPAAEEAGLVVDSDADGEIDLSLETPELSQFLTETVYDALGRVVLAVDELGREYGTVYDALGRVAIQVDPHPVSGKAFHSRDAADLGNADRVVGLATRFTYDLNGNLTAVTDPLNQTTWTVYDERNRATRQVNALAEINPADTTQKLDLDPDGNGELNTELVPDLDHYSTVTTYDDANQLVLVTDELGRQYGTVYDQQGRVIAETMPSTETEEVVIQEIDFGSTAIQSFHDGEQDDTDTSVFTVEDDGATLRLTGNAWKYIDLGSLVITPQTVLEFDFASSTKGELHGIGFEKVLGNVNNIWTGSTGQVSRYFQLANADLGVFTDSEIDFDHNVDAGFKPFRIHLADLLGEGSEFDRMVFVADDDAASIGESVFRNVRFTEQTAAVATARYAYDDNGNLVGSQDAEGRTSYTFYDRLNRPTHTVNADAKALVDGEHADPTHSGYLIPDNPYASALDGFTVKTTYDAASQVVLVTDEEGRQYGTVYDRAGRVLADVAPDAATGFAFNGAGFVAGLSLDPRLTPEAPTLDAVLAAAGLVGRTTTYTYDSADQLLSVTDALRNDTHPQGQTAWSFYDALGRLTYTVDERGDAWVDPGDIKVAAWTPGESLPAGDPEPTKNGDQNGDGHPDFAVRREYDPVGRLVGYTDPNGHTTSYAYDHADRQTVMTDSLGKNDAYRYDDNGNLVYTINRAGEQFTYAYDELNRMEIEQWFAADADPEADSPLRWFEYTYRDDSQVESVSEFDNINTAVALQTDAYTYDVAGRLLTETIDRRDSNIPTVVFTYAYDESDRPVSVTDSLNGVTSYTYDDQGRVKTVTQSSVAGDSSPATRVTYTYNLAGQMQTAVHAAEAPGQPSSSVDYITTHFSLYEYDQAGRLHRLTHHNDSDNPLDGANVTPARIIARYTYDRDALDRPDNIDHFAPPSIPGERTTDYTYDPAGQILGAVITNPDPTDPLVANNEDESYTYDGAGNRLTDNGDATTTADDTDVVTAEGSNRLESDGTYSYTYDDAGRLTQRDAIDSDISEKYDWDHRGRLTGITKLDNGQPLSGTFYVYDAQDRLVRRTDWSGLSSLAADTAYFYVGNERRLSVDLSQESKPVTRYLNAPGSETPTAVLAPATTPGGSDDRTYWLLADAAGTVRDVLDGGSSIAVPGEVIVFENGFETSSNPGTTSLGVSGSWSSNFRIATTPGSSARKFLGEYAESEFVTLQLTNLPEEHGKLRISFDLYVLKTWDGVDASAGSPDEFSFTIDGDELLKASFSNVAGNGLGQPQSYGEGEVGRLPHDTDIIYLSQSGAEERNTLGYTLNPEFYTDFIDPDTGEPTVTDSVYRLTFLVDHTATSALLKFASSGLDPAWDESWGIDNLEVAVVDSTTVEVADHIEYAQFGEVLGRSQNDQVVLDAISADGFGFGFQGRAQDGTTGLTHHNARWADPKSGRFLTEDPSGFTFGDPNLYRYVGNAPSVYADPTGLAFIKNGSSYAADSSVFSGPLTGSFGNPSTGNGGLGDPFSGLAITANVSGFDQGGTNYDGGLLLVGLGASGSSPATIQAPTSQSGLTFDDLGPMGQLHLSLGTVSPTPKPTGPTLRGFVESLKQAANETKDTFDQKYALDIEWEINRIQNLEQQYYAALDSGDTLVAGRLLNSIRSANRYFTEGIAQDEDLIADLFKRADHANFQRRLPELQAQALRDAEEAYQRELDEIYEEHGAFGVFIRDAVARQEIFANTLTFGATDKLGLTNSSQYVGDSFNVTRITAGIYREALITGATLGSGALVQAGRGGLALRGVSYAGRAYEGYQAARSGISGYANILQGNYGKGSLELATGLLSSAGAVGRIGNVKPSGGGSLQIGLSKQSSSVPESLRGAYPNGVLDDYLTFHKSVSTATALTQSPRIVVLNEHMWKNVWTPGQRWTVLEEELFHLRNITKYAEGGRLDRFHQTLLNTHLGRAVEEARARYHSSGRLRHSIEYGVRYKAGNHTVGLAEVTWRGLARDGLVLSTGFVGLAGLANATKSLIVNALGDDR